ncbi:MAG TPA: RsmE family RNA methyltransferase [Chitinophagaceae bacterium]|jgi:RNA methyltransferase, RsmE family
MSLPLFFLPDYDETIQHIELNEETSRHIVQVLRMKKDEELQLTNGKGALLNAIITDDHKKRTKVVVQKVQNFPLPTRKVSIAVSPLKNTNRFEWMLEKITEIGAGEIIPLICHRTEKQKLRMDRLHGIVTSALLQSHQVWLPQLYEPIPFQQLIENAKHQQKFIAHCIEDAKTSLADAVNSAVNSQIILIGPEGDFTSNEIGQALSHHFTPVTLGENRLRTETAAVVATTLLKIC